MEDKNIMNEIIVNKVTKYYFNQYKFDDIIQILEREAEEVETIRSNNRLTEEEIVIDVQESIGLNKAIADDYEENEE